MPALLQFFKNIGSRFPQRWVMIFTCFLGLTNIANVQICISIAITKMVASKNHTADVRSFKNESLGKENTFEWDEKTQAQILSAYYWGYIVSCVFVGSILNKLGGKHAFGLSILSTSLLTLVVPQIIEWGGATSLIVTRFLIGIGGGIAVPAIVKLISRWTPAEERSRASAWALAGRIFGSIVGTGTSGVIIQRSESGWPTMFYAYGVLGIVIYCVQCGICYESPSEHPFISESEVKLLKEKLKHSSHTADLPPTPWYHIVRSKPLWALLVALIGNSWCHITIISDTPKFMSSVLKLNVETIGYVSSIPYLSFWISSCALSWVADRLIIEKITSIAGVRKISNTIAMLGTGLFLVVSTYVGVDQTFIVGLHILAMAMFGCIYFSTQINVLDLAPNYAGTIQGILFSACKCVGFMSPYAAGWLTPNQTIYEWRTVFWLIFVIGAVTDAVFVIFGEAEVQRWNEPDFLRGGKDRDGDDVQESIELASEKMSKNEIVQSISS